MANIFGFDKFDFAKVMDTNSKIITPLSCFTDIYDYETNTMVNNYDFLTSCNEEYYNANKEWYKGILESSTKDDVKTIMLIFWNKIKEIVKSIIEKIKDLFVEFGSFLKKTASNALNGFYMPSKEKREKYIKKYKDDYGFTIDNKIQYTFSSSIPARYPFSAIDINDINKEQAYGIIIGRPGETIHETYLNDDRIKKLFTKSTTINDIIDKEALNTISSDVENIQTIVLNGKETIKNIKVDFDRTDEKIKRMISELDNQNSDYDETTLKAASATIKSIFTMYSRIYAIRQTEMVNALSYYSKIFKTYMDKVDADDPDMKKI